MQSKRKNKAEKIIDATEEQVFLQKRRLTLLTTPGAQTRRPTCYDGWMIDIEDRVFHSSLTDEIIKLGRTFAVFITRKKDSAFYPTLTVVEIANISNTKSYDEKRVAWHIKQKINKVLSRADHYSHKPPIDIVGSSGAGDDYAKKSAQLKEHLINLQEEQAETALRSRNWYEIVGSTLA